ncbi:hypothetical protein PSY57_23455, partial [Shigella flexneri]|nr:hypothetical protein [Shigella flexneri]
NITYRTINDYGALTPKMTGVIPLRPSFWG